MADTKITVIGLEEVRRRFARAGGDYKKFEKEAVEDSLLAFHEKVPAYPAPPKGSTYVRTGTLGRSLGVNRSGGLAGRADIYTNKAMSGGGRRGTFGTNLSYASYVIGAGRTKGVDKQAAHMSHWWTMNRVRDDAIPKIKKIFEAMARELARRLEGGWI